MLSNQRVRTIGLLLADKVDGPFQLDLRRIRAVHLSKELTNQDVEGPIVSSTHPTSRQAGS